jgi:hypothetical protein
MIRGYLNMDDDGNIFIFAALLVAIGGLCVLTIVHENHISIDTNNNILYDCIEEKSLLDYSTEQLEKAYEYYESKNVHLVALELNLIQRETMRQRYNNNVRSKCSVTDDYIKEQRCENT